MDRDPAEKNVVCIVLVIGLEPIGRTENRPTICLLITILVITILTQHKPSILRISRKPQIKLHNNVNVIIVAGRVKAVWKVARPNLKSVALPVLEIIAGT